MEICTTKHQATAGRYSVVLACVALVSAPMHAIAQEEGPRITGVDLGQSGIALYTLTHNAKGQGSIPLTVPLAHADDVLASLLVRDPSGGVIGLSTATPGTVPEVLRETPFSNGLPTSTVALLAALKGSTVRVLTPRTDATGAVLGIGRVQDVVGETVIDYQAVSLLTSDGTVIEVVLLPESSVEIPENAVTSLSEAARSLVDEATQRTFDLDLEATDPRKIELSYVTEAPAWKNSWRLLLDEGRLQGWATFENTSGQDWSGIDLILSTGVPVAYRRDLLSPRRIDRLAPPALMTDRPDVRADAGFATVAEDMVMEAAPNFRAQGVANQAPAPVSGGAREAVALQGIGNIRYTIPQPVDLPAGRTAGLLYLDLAIHPEVQALYQPGQSADVFLAVQLTAEQALAPGLVSVRDANGFVGDAPFTGLAADQSRLLPYASVPDASIIRDRSDDSVRVNINATGGALAVEVRSRIRTEYRASLPGDVDIFAVEHPKSGSRFLEATGEVEENATFVRVSKPVENGAVAIEIVEEDIEVQHVSLDRNGYRQVIAILGTGNVEIDGGDRAILDEASGVVRTIQSAERQLEDAQARYDSLLVDQKRLRDNLGAVQTNDLRRHYENNLGDTEDEITGLLDMMDAARAAVREGEQRLDAVIGRFR